MTLLEVIVALTVAGAALAAGAAVLGFLTDQQERTAAQSLVSAHAVRTTIRDWVGGARLTTEGDAEFRGSNEITFVTGASTDVAPAGTQVHIYMKEREGLVAELTPFRHTGAPVVVSLSPEATGLKARYLGSVFGARVWQPSWISTSVLPAAIELRIQFDTTKASADRAAHALLALPMTIPIGARR